MRENVIYRIKSETPLVVAGNQKLRFGLDKKVLTLSSPEPWAQKLLLELRRGVQSTELLAFASTQGVNKEELSSFVKQLSPVLETVPLSRNPRSKRITVIGEYETEKFIAEHLTACCSKVTIGRPKQHAQIVVCADKYIPNILQYNRWIYEGHSVLPVIFSDKSINVGPLLNTFEASDKYRQIFKKKNPKKYRYWVSQLGQSKVATETPATLFLVCGLIYEKIEKAEEGLKTAVSSIIISNAGPQITAAESQH